MIFSFLLSLPVATLAATETINGKFYAVPGDSNYDNPEVVKSPDGTNIYWTLKIDGSTASLTISGDGYMPNAMYKESWHSVLPSDCFITSVTINEGVKSIMNSAFYGESSLSSIKLPESLEIIGEGAFSGTNISSVTIPSKVEKVSLSQFEPTVIENINVSSANPYLKSVNGVVYSKDGTKLVAFPVARYNKESYSFNIPNTVTEIGEYAFSNCQMKYINIPNSVKVINQFAFAGNIYLSSVSLGKNIQLIEDCAFFSCDALGYIYLPASLQRIEYNSVGCIYDIDLPAIRDVLASGNLPYIEDINYIAAALITLDYSIDQFLYCVINPYFLVLAPSGSVGENHANRIGVRFKASSCSPSRIIKGESLFNGVKLTWSVSADCEGYVLEKLDLMGEWVEIYRTNNPKVTSFTDKNAIYNYENKYRIKAINSNGESFVLQNSYNVMHYKSPVVKKAVNSVYGIEVTWTSVSTAQKYYLYRKGPADSNFIRVAALSADELSYVDSNVSNGKTYTYTVKSYDGERYSNYDTVGISCKYISAPKVTVTSTQNGITVKWTKNSSATSYSVYKKTGSGNSVLIKTAKSNELSFYDSSVKSGTTYKYYVKANIRTVKSAAYTNSSQALKFLSTPTVKAANVTNGVKVSWSKVSGASGYYVYRRNSGSSSWSRIATVKKGSTVSYTDKSAKNSKKYDYTVKAYSGKYKSLHKNPGARNLFISTPKLKSVKSTKVGITIAFAPVSHCDGYYIYRKTGNGKWVKITTVKGASKSSYTDKTAKKGKTYTYTVKAFDGKTASSFYSGLKIKDRY